MMELSLSRDFFANSVASSEAALSRVRHERADSHFDLLALRVSQRPLDALFQSREQFPGSKIPLAEIFG